MKRILLSIAVLIAFSQGIFAQAESEEPDEDTTYIYETNGKGDQYINGGIFVNFPLNFGNPFKTDEKGNLSEGSLYTGGAAEIGYHRYLNSWFALGGDLLVAYNPTIGSNSLTMVPILFCVTVQPTIRKFEFPIKLGLGLGFETCQNKKYFPSPVFKAEVGGFYRITESFSAGITGLFLYTGQWAFDQDKNSKQITKRYDYDYGMFAMASLSVRYHF